MTSSWPPARAGPWRRMASACRSQAPPPARCSKRVAPARLGVPDARTALLVPMLHRGVGIGVLAAFDHGSDGTEFSAEDELQLRAFAQSAANAVAIKRSVEADRLRAAIAAADA